MPEAQTTNWLEKRQKSRTASRKPIKKVNQAQIAR